MLTIYILLGFFFISTLVFVFLYIINLCKLKNVVENVLTLNIRKGYYTQNIDLVKSDDENIFDTYKVLVYVTEQDKYINEHSKISLDKIEIISGIDMSKYKFVKEIVTSTFCSLKKTSDIEWLESENEIKELRKEKLNKIRKNKKRFL